MGYNESYSPERKAKRVSTWLLLNIIARSNQKPSHYVEAFKKAADKSEIMQYGRTTDKAFKILTVEAGHKTADGIPTVMKIRLITFSVVDKDAFYNLEKQADVTIQDWDTNIVANKKEHIFYFFPLKHLLAVPRSMTIHSAKECIYKVLNDVEPETFNVEVVTERNIIEQIKRADKIIRIEAKICFSNPGHPSAFKGLLDDKMRESDAESVNMTINGSKNRPLSDPNDGLVEAVIEAGEKNGEVVATVQETPDSKITKIRTSDYPRSISLGDPSEDLGFALWQNISNLN